MLVLAFLRGLVVVGHDLQLAVGAYLAGVLGQLNGFGGGVGTATSHHGHAPCGLLDGHADDLAVLLHVHRGGFTRGADHADAVRSLLDVPIDELAKACVVHAAIFKHGGDKGDDAACKGGAGGGHVRS